MAGFAWFSFFLITSRWKGAKGVARNGFPPARAPSERLVWLLCCWCCQAAFASAFPGLDARLGGHGAVPEPVGLVARLHDVAVVGEPVQ